MPSQVLLADDTVQVSSVDQTWERSDWTQSLFDLDMPCVLASCRVHALRHVHDYRSFGT